MKKLFVLVFLAAVLGQSPVFAVNDGNGRPKVGIVLAGGGAKGAAHIGILKYLEEQGIPVDFIAGTSMGSIIGGLYSIGYTSSQLDSVIKAADWPYYFSNVVNRKNRSYTDKYLGDKYRINIPFSFKDREHAYDLHTRQNANELESNGELVNKNTLPPIMRSLAAGIVDGDKLENLFNELCTGYQDSLDFSEFPIPFTCIATDLLGGKEYEIHSGRLPFAMRASMSIPIMFPPVDYDGRLLVDGGMVNNFPSDICRKMGADIIIGVELNEGFRADKKDINSMPGLLAQLFKIVTSGHNAENRKLCDVYIQPNVSGYGMMSFSSQSVDSLIAHGYNAAKECAEEISAVKASLGEYAVKELPARSTMQGDDEIHLSSIYISGLNSKEAAWMTSKWSPEFKKSTTFNEIRNIIAKYKGTGMFTSVNYALSEAENGEKLNIKFTKKQPNAARVGLWIDSEEAIALGLNFGIRENELQGLKGNFNARISSNPYINLRGTLAIPSVFNLNLDGGIRFTRREIYSEGMIWGSSRLMNASGRLYLSDYYSRLSNISGGLQFEWNREYETDYALESYGEKRMSSNASLFLDYSFDSRDHVWKATRGMMLNISGRYRFWSNDEYWKIINPNGGLLSANISAECYISPGNGLLTFIPQYYSRIWLGDYCDINTLNCIGGWQNGRYGEQHLPFIGLSNTELLDGQDVAVARMDIRWHIGGIHYLTGIYNHVWSEGAYSNNGAALKYTLDLPIGPLSLYALWSDIPATYPKWNIGLSFGTYF